MQGVNQGYWCRLPTQAHVICQKLYIHSQTNELACFSNVQTYMSTACKFTAVGLVSCLTTLSNRGDSIQTKTGMTVISQDDLI